MSLWRNILLVAVYALAHCWSATAQAGETYLGYEGYWRSVVATAYSPQDPIDGHYRASKGERWKHITADGTTDVREDPYGIAVPYRDGRPLFVEYGTAIIVPVETGYLKNTKNRIFYADDTGGTINRNTRRTGVPHIDLRYQDHSWAKKWGKKSIRVFVITGRAPPAPPRPWENSPFWTPELLGAYAP